MSTPPNQPPSRPRSSVLATATGLAIEILLWMAPALGFLWLYVGIYLGPETAIPPHLALVLTLALLMCSLRLCLGGRWIRPIFSLAYATTLWAVLLYYTITLAGLASWGRVAHWPLLQVYLHQWDDLLRALDISPILGPIVLLASLLAIVAAVFAAHRRLRWPVALRAALGAAPPWALAMLFATLFGLRVQAAHEAHDARSGEPVMLFMNAWLGVRNTQNNNSEGSRLLDLAEARAADAYEPATPSHRRNVFLIVGDALRGDRLPLLGYSRPTMPYLESLAQSGRVALARRATAVCAESYCGLMGIARSKFVHQFSRQSLTLQKVLRRHGYRIGLVLSGDHTNFYGLGNALGPADFYWDSLKATGYVNDDRGLVEYVRSMEPWDGQPTAVQFHLMSSHGLGLRQPDFRQFAPARNYYPNAAFRLDPEQTRQLASNYYDNGMLQFDAVVKDLLAALDAKGYLDDAVVVITGDHGEMLGEHGRYAHAEGVYQPALDVPFLLLRYGYDGPPLQPDVALSQVDIAPTLLDELAFPIPPTWSGISARAPMRRDFIYFQQGRLVGLTDFRHAPRVWKYWKEFPNGSEHAFDLGEDPGELNNLAFTVDPDLRASWLLELLPLESAVVRHPAIRFNAYGRVEN